MVRVLLVDEDDKFCEDLSLRLNGRGYGLVRESTTLEGIRSIQELEPTVLLAGLTSSGGSANSLLDASCKAGVPAVVMSNAFSSQLVLESIARGAYDCIPKPVDDISLDNLFRRLAIERPYAAKRDSASEIQEPNTDDEMVVGRCPEMIEALKTVGSIATTTATVLIRGESGTGKELLAREVHNASGRNGTFLAVNCAAVMETLAESELFGHERGAFTGASERRAGCFEQADKGTLFLDEIGDATPAFQAKLLRVLDRGEFRRIGGRDLIRPDVRVVVATNSPLETLTESGEFRQDLYYRLSEVTISLPTLRSRLNDIPTFVDHMLRIVNFKSQRRIEGISRTAMEALMAYDWPGNLRELQNIVHQAVLLCKGSTIQTIHLKGLGNKPDNGSPPQIRTLDEIEREHISNILEITHWNRGRSCDLLGISRPTLRRKMRRYEIIAKGLCR